MNITVLAVDEGRMPNDRWDGDYPSASDTCWSRFDSAVDAANYMFRLDIDQNNHEYEFYVIDNDASMDDSEGDNTGLCKTVHSLHKDLLKAHDNAQKELAKIVEAERKANAIRLKKSREKRLIAKEIKKLAELKKKYPDN